MSARASRRQVLALVALQDNLPEPRLVQFADETVRLSFDCVADLHAWRPYFRIAKTAVTAQPYTHEDGKTTTLANAYRWNDWHGWTVHLNALDPVTEPELDEAMREQLRAVASESTTEAGVPC